MRPDSNPKSSEQGNRPAQDGPQHAGARSAAVSIIRSIFPSHGFYLPLPTAIIVALRVGSPEAVIPQERGDCLAVLNLSVAGHRDRLGPRDGKDFDILAFFQGRLLLL